MAIRDDLVPPNEVLPRYARSRDFARAGKRFRRTARRSGLMAGHRVLDLGCGYGRFAVALEPFLDAERGGSYLGIDIVEDAVEVCQTYIGAKVPSFDFVHVDVFNTQYNASAQTRAADLRLPIEDEDFDFAFSNSLFTHLVPGDARGYLCEMGRGLRSGALAMNTMFLLNDVSAPLLDAETGRRAAPHYLEEGARVRKLKNPEAWIAFDEAAVLRWHADAGLEVVDVRYGDWSGRPKSGPGFGSKDIVVARRV